MSRRHFQKEAWYIYLGVAVRHIQQVMKVVQMRRIALVIIVLLGFGLYACSGGPSKEREKVAMFDGVEPAVTHYFHLRAGWAEFEWYYSAPMWSNFKVILHDEYGQYYTLAINDGTGDAREASGTERIRINESGEYRLLIDWAEGNWTIIVKQ